MSISASAVPSFLDADGKEPRPLERRLRQFLCRGAGSLEAVPGRIPGAHERREMARDADGALARRPDQAHHQRAHEHQGVLPRHLHAVHRRRRGDRHQPPPHRRSRLRHRRHAATICTRTCASTARTSSSGSGTRRRRRSSGGRATSSTSRPTAPTSASTPRDVEARVVVINSRIMKAIGFDWFDQLEPAQGFRGPVGAAGGVRRSAIGPACMAGVDERSAGPENRARQTRACAAAEGRARHVRPRRRCEFRDFDPIPKAFRLMVRGGDLDVSEMAICTHLLAHHFGKPITGLAIPLWSRLPHANLVCADRLRHRRAEGPRRQEGRRARLCADLRRMGARHSQERLRRRSRRASAG